MKTNLILLIAVFAIFLLSTNCNKDEDTSKANFNDVKITVKFNGSKKVNTIPMTKRSPKIKMLSTASMLGEVIRRVHNNESVNSLFESNT